ncbi:MAG: hypothetical protein HYY84_20845 [Deltaproteobacteria bacterium]|nr:hypothetical protein [Deltaproteobacteria bacterium]
MKRSAFGLIALFAAMPSAFAVNASPGLLGRVPQSFDVVIEASLAQVLSAGLAEQVARALARESVSWRSVGVKSLRLGVGLDEMPLVASIGNRKGKGAAGFVTLMKLSRKPSANGLLARSPTVGPFRATGSGVALRNVRRVSSRRGSWEANKRGAEIRRVLTEWGDPKPAVALYYVPHAKDAARDFPDSNLKAAVIGLDVAGGVMRIRFLAHAPSRGAAVLRRQVETVIRLGKIALWAARLGSKGEKHELLGIAKSILDGFQIDARGDWLHGTVAVDALPDAGRVGGLVLRAFERMHQ